MTLVYWRQPLLKLFLFKFLLRRNVLYLFGVLLEELKVYFVYPCRVLVFVLCQLWTIPSLLLLLLFFAQGHILGSVLDIIAFLLRSLIWKVLWKDSIRRFTVSSGHHQINILFRKSWQIVNWHFIFILFQFGLISTNFWLKLMKAALR